MEIKSLIKKRLHENILKEVFDLKNVLPYEIDHNDPNSFYAFAATIQYKDDKGEDKRVYMVIDADEVPTEQENYLRLYTVTFTSEAKAFQQTNDQKAMEIINTVAHLLLKFIKDHEDLFEHEKVLFDLYGVKDDDDFTEDSSKRDRIYSYIVNKHMNELSGNWTFNQQHMVLHNVENENEIRDFFEH